eukprot:TRINITY_DN12625_c0_g1_i1.p1 TRINITY_DN12625_c0_g1~~TRINITY_DN12625_c0_g1_i1.p1  ORF type:complete len:446 (+),score=174.19 TRINITY_DN12625_c0_g1_i1:123-1460(+)
MARRPKGFGLFATAAQEAAPKASTMEVLKEEPVTESWRQPEVQRAMAERGLEFKKNGATRTEVGRGAFAKAYLAEGADKRPYVIKEVDLSTLKEAQRKKADLEVAFLQSLNHENVIRCTDAFTCASVLHIVLDYASNGTLMAKIDGKKAEGGAFAPAQVLRWYAHLLSALRHLHHQRILHRDLKTANVFLDHMDQVKLGDFGLSRKQEDDENYSGQMVGTPYYFAPEVVTSKPFSNKTDIWSATVIAYELAYLNKPFNAKSIRGLYKKIQNVDYAACPDGFDADVKRLIESVLVLEPRDRPSAKTLCKDPALEPYVVGEPAPKAGLGATLKARAAAPVSASAAPKAAKSKAVGNFLDSIVGLAPAPPKRAASSPPQAAAPSPQLPAASPPKSAGEAALDATLKSPAEASDEYAADFDSYNDSDFEDFDEGDDYDDDFEDYSDDAE